MRWGLRDQIVVWFTSLLAVTLLGVTIMNMVFSKRQARDELALRLNGVSSILKNSTFPLTENVLIQMKGLSGADFVLTNKRGVVLKSTLGPSVPQTFEFTSVADTIDQEAFTNVRQVGDQAYYQLTLSGPRLTPEETFLHLLIPAQSMRATLRTASAPPLVCGVGGLILAVALGYLMAGRIAQPLNHLRDQVEQLARGSYELMPLPQRHDELFDLTRTVNHLTSTLRTYEGRVRQHEQVRTINQLGAGLAHQLRNLSTGCRMALDLHLRDYPAAAPSESLSVARRQLILMEEYLQRFQIRDSSAETPRVPVELCDLLHDTWRMFRPLARHARVELDWQSSVNSCIILGDEVELQQVFINLLANAIDAARCNDARQATNDARPTGVEPSGADPAHVGRVSIRLELRDDPHEVWLVFADDGAGPDETMGDLFAPLVSNKADGAGLGLAIAREIIEHHEGHISWRRAGNLTFFEIRFPLSSS